MAGAPFPGLGQPVVHPAASGGRDAVAVLTLTFTLPDQVVNRAVEGPRPVPPLFQLRAVVFEALPGVAVPASAPLVDHTVAANHAPPAAVAALSVG